MKLHARSTTSSTSSPSGARSGCHIHVMAGLVLAVMCDGSILSFGSPQVLQHRYFIRFIGYQNTISE